ncbi:MAG: ThuA domain-containing protein [Verrucomicrobia bacterium]|nr:ThuA domain-containing protein [Verrucomicrobiota bacterium]
MNRRTFVKHSALAALVAPAMAPRAASSAEADKPVTAPLRVAVVTGGHLFDVPNFHKLFRSFPGIEADIQYMDDFVATPAPVRDQYDVVLFYHMLMHNPPPPPVQAALEHLGATEQGIVAMHHALLAYPQWSVWSEVVGIADRKFGFHYNQTVQVRVANVQHPITRGLKNWEMIDETYTMADAGEGSEILLTVDHPKSMKTIAWARQFKKSRVFCTESGHDNQTWANPNYREVLRRGIQWCARRS